MQGLICVGFDLCRVVPIPGGQKKEKESFVAAAYKRRKTTPKNISYVDVSHIPPTSNVCEGFFSAAKLTYSDLRQQMDFTTLEDVMFLKYNHDLWDAHTVQTV